MPPPPKAKLHANKGKLKKIQPTATQPDTSSETDEVSVETQFQLELLWCIRQLEGTLQDGKLSDRQKLEAEKTLKTLQNNKQPLIQKRLLMRITFGDYRTKMATEQKKLQLNATKMKIEPVEAVGQKSLLVRKHIQGDVSTQILAPSDNTFRFNFAVE